MSDGRTQRIETSNDNLQLVGTTSDERVECSCQSLHVSSENHNNDLHWRERERGNSEDSIRTDWEYNEKMNKCRKPSVKAFVKILREAKVGPLWHKTELCGVLIGASHGNTKERVKRRRGENESKKEHST